MIFSQDQEAQLQTCILIKAFHTTEESEMYKGTPKQYLIWKTTKTFKNKVNTCKLREIILPVTDRKSVV